jgi:hypothetical protein
MTVTYGKFDATRPMVQFHELAECTGKRLKNEHGFSTAYPPPA